MEVPACLIHSLTCPSSRVQDKNGTVDHDELTKALERLGARLSDREIDDVFNASDMYTDGRLTFKEFLVSLALGPWRPGSSAPGAPFLTHRTIRGKKEQKRGYGTEVSLSSTLARMFACTGVRSSSQAISSASSPC